MYIMIIIIVLHRLLLDFDQLNGWIDVAKCTSTTTTTTTTYKSMVTLCRVEILNSTFVLHPFGILFLMPPINIIILWIDALFHTITFCPRFRHFVERWCDLNEGSLTFRSFFFFYLLLDRFVRLFFITLSLMDEMNDAFIAIAVGLINCCRRT